LSHFRSPALSLNLGCGEDDWGDIRIDVDFRTQTGLKSKLNIRADAHHLPFRDHAFADARCWHVLEHARNPRTVMEELRRTCKRVSVRFPVDEGYKMQMLIGLTNLEPARFIHAYRTFRRRAHLWIIRPFGNARISDRFIEYPVWHGRKGPIARRLFRPRRYYFEWEVIDATGSTS